MPLYQRAGVPLCICGLGVCEEPYDYHVFVLALFMTSVERMQASMLAALLTSCEISGARNASHDCVFF